MSLVESYRDFEDAPAEGLPEDTLLQGVEDSHVNDASTLPQPLFEHKGDSAQHAKLIKWIDSVNIAEDLEEETLNEIGQKVKREYDLDVQSRNDWVEKSEKAMKLAMQVAEAKVYPWPRASNVIYPLMTVAAIQFAARAYPAIISGRNVVKGVVVGDDSGVPLQAPDTGNPVLNAQTGEPAWVVPPGAKTMLADKIGEHMSWQLLDEQSEWEEETDKLLHVLAIVGCCFRKTFYDYALGRNVSLLVPAENLVINYHAKSLETAPRLTEKIKLYPLEILDNENAGAFLPLEYGPPPDASQDEDAPHLFLEQHRLLDLDDDGYPEPYVVTVHEQTAKVVRIVARYDAPAVRFGQDGKVIKIDAIQYYTKYDFLPNPESGIYGIGFGQLLRPINEATNTTLNMLIDAGHLANTGGGFIGKSLSMHMGNIRFTPGEYKTVNVSGATVKENIVPLTFPGPSTVLFQLLGSLIEAGKEIAAVKDVLTGEQKNANVPATTTLALIEQGLKVFTAIYKRIHRALKKELAKLYRLNSIHIPEAGAGYNIDNHWKTITKADYTRGSGVEPVSDPTMVSDMQKLGRAQFLMGFANDPMMNGIEIRRRVLNAALIEKVDELILKQPPPDPEMMAKAKELQIRDTRTQAEAIKDYAQAVLAIAQADAVLGKHDLSWYEHQLEIYKTRLDAIANGLSAPEPPSAPDSPPATRSEGGRLPSLEAPSGNQSDTSVSPGLSQLTQGGGM